MSNNRFCTTCGVAQDELDNLFCTSCGSGLAAPVERVECPGCSVLVEAGAAFCTSCGRNLVDRPVEAPAPNDDVTKMRAPARPAAQPWAEPAAFSQPPSPPATAYYTPDAPPAEPKRSLLLVPAAVALLALIGVAGWFGFKQFGPGGDESAGVSARSDALDPEPTPPTLTETETETETATATETATETETALPAPAVMDAADFGCYSSGVALPGVISGVENWATVRTEPDIGAAEVTNATSGSDLVYFPTSTTRGRRYFWVEVSHRGMCGWVANKFIKKPEGQLVGGTSGWDYVNRALKDLEPEVLHASVVYGGPDGDDPTPPDDAELSAFIDALRQLDREAGPLEPVSDPAHSDEPAVEGCYWGDYMYCRVLLVGPFDDVVAVAEVDYVGDGVSTARLVSE